MSIITYNGITLPMAYLTGFNQEAVYDDSGTDRIYTKIDVAAQCLINANYLGLLNENLRTSQGGAVTRATTDNAAVIMAAVRQQLLQQRRALSITFNQQELIPFRQVGTAFGGDVDARNGPIPQYCNVTQLTNVTFLLNYRIIAHYWDFPENDGDGHNIVPGTINDLGNSVLTNRWTEIQEIDNANYSTYTRTGKYIIRSDNADGLIADAYRPTMAVLAPRVGFLRQSSRYQVDPSGLAIEWQVVDKEQYKMPPSPAFEARGEYVESAVTPALNKRYGEVRVWLKGDLVTSQSQLIDTALQIATTKLAIRHAAFLQDPYLPADRIGIPQSAAVRVNLYQNEVEVSLRTFYQAAVGRAKGISAFQGLDTITPLSENNTLLPKNQPNYLLRGSADILLQAAAYYDPNLRDTTLNPVTRQLTNGLQVGMAGVNPEE